MQTAFLACTCKGGGSSEVRELATTNINYITSVEITLYLLLVNKTLYFSFKLSCIINFFILNTVVKRGLTGWSIKCISQTTNSVIGLF